MPAIEVNHVTKEYRLGTLRGIKETILNTGSRLLGKPVSERPIFRALDDITFDVNHGEVVGIIGHNGAGKSTLLKMLAKVATPTSGYVRVRDRVAPLIEVGAGFVPDFTGRENVYLNGAILGMSKKEIDRKLEDIVAFSEMSDFIDTPVKRYSSGMQVKLAFAVATSIDAEILIVDEVLAVGDLAFQRKCFDRMENMIKRQGKTVLLVSHNIRQVERLCTRVLLLNGGRLIEDGKPDAVCNTFTDLMNLNIQAERSHRHSREIQNSGEITDVIAETQPENETPGRPLRYGRKAIFRFSFQAISEIKGVAVYVGIHTTDFVYLTNNNTAYEIRDFSPGEHTIELLYDEINLIPGTYSVLLWIGTPEGKVTYHTENLCTFTVTSDDFSISRQHGQALFSMPGHWTFHPKRLISLVENKAPESLIES